MTNLIAHTRMKILDSMVVDCYATLGRDSMDKDGFGVILVLFIILVVIFDCGTKATIN